MHGVPDLSHVALLDVLSLERVDLDLFRSTVLFEEPESLYGGQVAAQALLAAGATVPEGRTPHSLHGYFLRPGDSHQSVVFTVERDRDGRSFSARRVVARQQGRVILNLSASFHDAVDGEPDETSLVAPEAGVAGPLSRPHRLIGFEQRPVGQPGHSWPTQVWLRCTEALPEQPLMHAAVLTYLSDIYTGHGSLASSKDRVQSTLDHALWLHRPARADRWLLMDLQSRAVSQGRGLYAGSVWSEDG
ncbi:MAG: thioesterase family protein, partial [Frankiales bacterium]|nr:thioesterase family protein [Frankiales bacterium]